jgi:putative ABC transport system permease protein
LSGLESIRIALRALAANKLRAGLTMLGMIIGVGAVIGMVAVGAGAQAAVTSQIESLGTNLLFIRPGAQQQAGVRTQAGSAPTLTSEDAEAIVAAQDLPVVAVAPEVNTFDQVLANGINARTRITATTPEYTQVRNLNAATGEFINRQHMEARSLVVVLGPTVAETLFPGQDPIGQTMRLSVGGRTGVNFRVIGVAEAKGGSGFGSQDDQIYIPLSTMQQRLLAQRTSRGTRNVAVINVQVTDADSMTVATERIGDLLRERHRVSQDDFTIQSQADFLRIGMQITGIMTVLLGSIAGISLVVGGIGIMNIMLVSVTERTREIGIRKAVGAKRRDVLLQFLVESVVVSLIGGTLGMLLGFLLATAVSGIDLGNGSRLQAVVTADAVTLAVGVSVAIGLFFGIFPAYRAARLNPIQALRYE